MRVLFVEDDPMNRAVVGDMLRIVGAELVEAESAEAGLALIGQQEFSLVLMDLRMPGMDGITAIRHIRARPDAKAALPVIVVTADTGLHIREDCLAGGADDVILKPVSMRQLFDAMGRVVIESQKRAAA